MSDQPEEPVFGDASDGERAPSIPPELPVLPLRDTVLFPNSFMPLAVARESSVKLIDDAIAGGKLIGAICHGVRVTKMTYLPVVYQIEPGVS